MFKFIIANIMGGSRSWQGKGHKQAWAVRPWEKQSDKGPTIFCKNQKEQFFMPLQQGKA